MSLTTEIDHNISKEFLAKALGEEFKILSFKVTHGTKPGDNFMSVIYSVDVQLEDKTGSELTKHLLIKCYPSHPGRQDFINKCNLFFKELEIYRSWIPELRRFQTEEVGLGQGLKLPFPVFVHGQCIDFESNDAIKHAGKVLDPLDNYIIMEDLRTTSGFRMTNRRETLDLDHLKLVFSELAKIHALSWAYKKHVESNVTKKFSCLLPSFGKESEMFVGIFRGNIDQAVKVMDETLGVDNKLSKACIQFKEILEPVFDIFYSDKAVDKSTEAGLHKLLRKEPTEEFGKDSPNPEPWRIVCHGDCWSNNMLFRYDGKTGKPLEVILVDLQLVRETCIVTDLVFLVYVCTRAEFRKNHLDELLQLYHDKFNEVCKLMKTETLPGFNIDSLRYRFHRGKLYGFAMALCGLQILLKDEDKAINLEEVDPNAKYADMLTDVMKNTGGDSNKLLNERIIEVTQEVYDQGVI